MCLQYKKIPPIINCKVVNPHISLNKSPFYIPDELQEWHQREELRCAGISSFGIGGTNAHVVIEEYVDEEKVENRRQNIEGAGPYMIVLSAKNEDRLRGNGDELT